MFRLNHKDCINLALFTINKEALSPSNRIYSYFTEEERKLYEHFSYGASRERVKLVRKIVMENVSNYKRFLFWYLDSAEIAGDLQLEIEDELDELCEEIFEESNFSVAIKPYYYWNQAFGRAVGPVGEMQEEVRWFHIDGRIYVYLPEKKPGLKKECLEQVKLLSDVIECTYNFPVKLEIIFINDKNYFDYEDDKHLEGIDEYNQRMERENFPQCVGKTAVIHKPSLLDALWNHFIVTAKNIYWSLKRLG